MAAEIFEDAMFANRGEIPLKLEPKEIGARSSLFRGGNRTRLLLLLLRKGSKDMKADRRGL